MNKCMRCLFLYKRHFFDWLKLNCQVPRGEGLKIPCRHVLRHLKTRCFEFELVSDVVKYS